MKRPFAQDESATPTGTVKFNAEDRPGVLLCKTQWRTPGSPRVAFSGDNSKCAVKLNTARNMANLINRNSGFGFYLISNYFLPIPHQVFQSASRWLA